MRFNIRNRRRRQLFGEFEGLRDDLSDLRHDLMTFGQVLLKSGKKEMGGAGSRLKSEVRRTVDSLSSGMGTARERGKESIEAVQQQIEERPFTSLGIAFALGLVIGKLLDWPTSDD